MILRVLEFPHPLLLTPTYPETAFNTILKTWLDDMWETMVAENGLGLSANQVGFMTSAFVMKNENGERLNIVNPVVLEKSDVPAMLKEGCLSAKGEFVILKERPSWVKISYQDETGEKKEGIFRGIHAVCVMHEMDHLLGKSHLQSPSLNRAQKRAFAKKWGLKG